MDNTFNIIECIKSNAITLIVAIYLIVIAYYMTKDPEKLFTKIYLYTTVAVVPNPTKASQVFISNLISIFESTTMIFLYLPIIGLYEYQNFDLD